MGACRLGLALSAALLCGGSEAYAYTLDNLVGDPCHETLTARALVAVRAVLSTAGPLEPSDDEQALIDDLPFAVADETRDLGAVSLLIGVRDNDLKGRRPNELDSLSAVHGDPAGQREHCLRRPDQDEPNGSEAALVDCRAFVRDRFTEALGGLGPEGAPDASIRADIDVALAVRGKVTARLPLFYVRIGQAMHAIQDGFSHTYRTADGAKVTVVLNWVDEANGTLDESRDGPPHSREMDRCDDPDELRAERRLEAEHASAELLHAGLDASLTTEGKLAALEALLESTLGYQPGCTADNAWCDAPEHAYGSGSACGCRAAGEPGSDGLPGFIGLGGIVLACARRRRAAWLVAASATLTSAAAADPAAEPEKSTQLPPADAGTKPKAFPDPGEPWRSAFGAAFSISAAFDNAALAATLGVRYRFAERWVAGLDGEWNPFVATNGSAMRSGTFNGYATLIRRWPLVFEPVNLRTTANLGTSVLLMDLYGAPAGSVGLYFGLSPLGLEWKVSRSFYLTADPLHIALPIPHLSGVPFAYGQYRSTIGAELDIL